METSEVFVMSVRYSVLSPKHLHISCCGYGDNLLNNGLKEGV